MQKIDAYIFFGGNCAEAMRFYEKVLEARIEQMMTHGESPMAGQSPPGMEKLVMHARLVGEGIVLMASDDLPGQYQGMKGFSLSITYSDVARARRIFDALAEGGIVKMPFDKTFWSEGFGMLTDQYGTSWMVNVGQ